MSENAITTVGLDVGLSAAGVPGTSSLLAFFAGLLDPGSRRRLEAAIEEHVLSELPRIHALLGERIAAVAASGCTPSEAQVIAYQVVEAQRQTLDDQKRRLLSNVLVNGLCAEHWDKAKHRLMVRLASELEPEHVQVLHEFVSPRRVEQNPWPDLSPEDTDRRLVAWAQVTRALTRELISRGLLAEATEASSSSNGMRRSGERRPSLQIEQKVTISLLGREFLDHVRDPETAEACTDKVSPE